MSRSYSLILGGGAARGYAHIGAIKWLEESGYHPDFIAGTSMGALIGAFYACGFSVDEMTTLANKISLLKLIDVDLRRGGVKGEKVMKFLEEHLGDKTFADTMIPLRIIATDFDTGEKTVFSTGRLADAIRASISIPGVFQAFYHEKKLYIDGGMTSNLPIEEAPKNLPVVAVSVQLRHWRDEAPGGILDMKKLSHTNVISGTYMMLRRSIQIMTLRNEWESANKNPNAYIVIVGREDIDYYAFNKVPELIDAGYESAKDAVSYLDAQSRISLNPLRFFRRKL